MMEDGGQAGDVDLSGVSYTEYEDGSIVGGHPAHAPHSGPPRVVYSGPGTGAVLDHIFQEKTGASGVVMDIWMPSFTPDKQSLLVRYDRGLKQLEFCLHWFPMQSIQSAELLCGTALALVRNHQTVHPLAWSCCVVQSELTEDRLTDEMVANGKNKCSELIEWARTPEREPVEVWYPVEHAEFLDITHEYEAIIIPVVFDEFPSRILCVITQRKLAQSAVLRQTMREALLAQEDPRQQRYPRGVLAGHARRRLPGETDAKEAAEEEEEEEDPAADADEGKESATQDEDLDEVLQANSPQRTSAEPPVQSRLQAQATGDLRLATGATAAAVLRPQPRDPGVCCLALSATRLKGNL